MSLLLGGRTTKTAGLTGAFAVLPVGSCEAHGPHLPLDTDVRIAEALALRAARLLSARGTPAVVLPTLNYGVTTFARHFEGTLSISADLTRGLVVEVLCAAVAAGATGLGLANAHFEPANVDALFAACAEVQQRTGRKVVFPHFGSRRLSEQLARRVTAVDGHAGRYETSLILALAPEKVRGHGDLPGVGASLAVGIVAGATCFEEAGGPDGYFGAPGEASAEQGEALLDAMAEMFVEGV
jgi:creatinine amidohydrolase